MADESAIPENTQGQASKCARHQRSSYWGETGSQSAAAAEGRVLIMQQEVGIA